MRLRVIVFATLLASLSQALPVQAQTTQTQTDNGVRFTTSPLPVNLSTKPGVAVSTELRVRNSGNQPEVFKVGLLTFKASGTTGAPLLRERQPGDDFFDWVSFSPQQFPIAPNEWKTVKMTITPPTSAAFGYYYAVTFSRADQAAPQGGQTSLQGSTAILVLLDVQSPNAKRQIKIDSFTTDHPWYEFLPATFSIKLTNSGNVHAAPYGTIFITQNSQTVGQIDINSTKGNILPSSSRTFSGDWTAGFPVNQPQTKDGKVVLDDKGHQLQQLHWDFGHADRFRLGLYTAKLVMAYDNGTRDVPLEATLSFWVIPWRILLGGLVVGLLVGIGLFTTGRSLWRKSRTLLSPKVEG